MKKIIVISFFTSILLPSILLANPVYYIHAHQDDWQLFMGASVFRDVAYGAKVTFIYTTAGDAGKEAVYWQSREFAAWSSTRTVAGSPGSWNSSFPIIRGHRIKRCTYKNTVSYFMRLEEAGRLNWLRDSGIPINAVDGSTSYQTWDDFYLTIREIIKKENVGQTGPVWINAPENDRQISPNDNRDHYATADAVVAAVKGYKWGLVRYSNYDIQNRPINLSIGEYTQKKAAFMAYDQVMIDRYGESTYNESPLYEKWLPREYRR